MAKVLRSSLVVLATWVACARPAHAEEPPASQTPPTAPAPEHASTTTDHTASRPARTLGWVSFSIGAEATVFAIVTSVMMLHEKSVRDDNCNAAKVCNFTGLNENNMLGALAGWNAAAWGLAAVGLGVGGFLLLTNPPEGSRGTAVFVSPNGSGVGVGVRGAF